MADSILVRFEDELAKQLRDRARHEQTSITGFINDAVKIYLEQLSRSDRGEDTAKRWGEDSVRRFGAGLAEAHQAIASQTDPWKALAAILECLEIMSAGDDPNLERVTWDEFRFSPANETADDNEARRLFAAQYHDVAQRDWTWYLRSCKSEDEAKAVWLRQRRSFGIPVPPKTDND